MAATNCLDPVAGAPQLGDFSFEGVFSVDSASDVNIISANDINLTSTFDMLFTSANNNITFSTPGDSFEVNAGQDVRINGSAELRLNSAFLTAPAIPSATTAEIIYIHPTSHALSRGALPTPTLSFISVSGTTQAMAVNTSYVAKNVALTTFTLPATAAAGSVIQVSGATTGLFEIAQNAGQSVRLGSTVTTVGVTGSTSSTAIGNAVYLQCITANTEFIVLNSVGTFNLI